MPEMSQVLARRCRESKRYDEGLDERLEMELLHIQVQELVAYYLALDSVGEAVDTDAHYVAYLLGLTDRFDPDKPLPMMGDMPDIDLDFSDRDVIVAYLKDKYGPDHVAYINNYNEFQGKSAMRDVAKVEKVAIPKYVQDDIEKLESVEAYLTDIAIRQNPPKISESVRKVLEYAARLEGNIRQYGKTAAGVIVSSEPVENFSAMRTQDGEAISVYDKVDAEDIGFIKMDVLNVSNIKVIDRALKLISERGGTPPENIWELPLDDRRMMDEFKHAHTRLIFQYGGKALIGLLERLEPDSPEDLIAANSLCRPGADDRSYIKRKRGEEAVTYPHPKAREFLEGTYGLPIYQEQVMQLCRNIGQMSWRDVNRVRKMVGKKDLSEAPELEALFKRGCSKSGLSGEATDKLWGEILKHGGYSFNRAHAVAYFVIAWADMYLQVYHPVEWILANLLVEEDDTKISFILGEANRLGVSLGCLDVNRSKATWSYDGDTLIHGLTLIPRIGQKAAELIAERAPYESLEDMQERLPKSKFTKAHVAQLIRVGAIPGSEEMEGYDPVYSRVYNGFPVDVTEGYDVHPLWNARPASCYGNEPIAVHGYVKSCRKAHKGDQEVVLHGDMPLKLYYHEKLEEGPYLLLVDAARFHKVYAAFPMRMTAEHPMARKFDLRKMGQDKEGVAYTLYGRWSNTGYVTMVLCPEPRVIWLNDECEAFKYYYFNEIPKRGAPRHKFRSIEEVKKGIPNLA